MVIIFGSQNPIFSFRKHDNSTDSCPDFGPRGAKISNTIGLKWLKKEVAAK
jgi:hypothetical protein